MERPILSEERLMALAAAGDEPAFQGLVRRLGSAMLTLAYRLTGNEAAAEEVFVDSVSRIWLRRSTYEQGRPVRPWLMAIVANTYREGVRRRRPWAGSPALEHAPAPDLMQDDGGNHRLRTALGGLPPRQREVLVLRIWGGLEYTEIGYALGMSDGTARSNMHHALAALRRSLGDLELRGSEGEPRRPRSVRDER